MYTLNFFASGSHQRRVGLNAFAIMSQSKVSFSVSRISRIISSKLARQHIVFPSTSAAANQKKEEFFEKFGVPGIIGLIDCTHIAIANINKQTEYAYVNRKRFHSLNVQAICDLNLKILNINARYPGSTHDSHIWDGSKINTIMQRINSDDHKSWLFVDSGYSLKPYMMVPFRRPDSEAERQYNVAHTKIRSDIERCFAILKNRFRCLKTASGHLHYSHVKAADIIYSCAALHNILINNNFPIDETDGIVEEEVPTENADEEDTGEENRTFLVNFIQERGLAF